jgi:hypothetical protein
VRADLPPRSETTLDSFILQQVLQTLDLSGAFSGDLGAVAGEDDSTCHTERGAITLSRVVGGEQWDAVDVWCRLDGATGGPDTVLGLFEGRPPRGPPRLLGGPCG